VDSIIASLAAITGVVLGSVLTYLFQARNTRQVQLFARDQQVRQERLAAYSELAGIVTEFAAAKTTGGREQEDPQGELFVLPGMSRISCAPRRRLVAGLIVGSAVASV